MAFSFSAAPPAPRSPRATHPPVISLNIYAGVMQGRALTARSGTQAPVAAFQASF